MIVDHNLRVLQDMSRQNPNYGVSFLNYARFVKHANACDRCAGCGFRANTTAIDKRLCMQDHFVTHRNSHAIGLIERPQALWKGNRIAVAKVFASTGCRI